VKTRDASIGWLRPPDEQKIDFLVNQKEDQWLERISARTQARTLGDLLVGFANAEGGLIAAGIHDGKIEGVAASERVNDWRQAAMDFTRPPVRHRLELLPCVNADGESDEIVVIEVESSERAHETAKGETFLRVGDENRRLGLLEAQELRYDKGESTYDASVLERVDLKDLDEGLVDRYGKSLGADAPCAQVLRARGLADDRGDRLCLTVAGLLVLGKHPQTLLPEATMRILRYRGSARESGVRANVIHDERLEGPIPLQIENARDQVQALLPKAMQLGGEGRFIERSIIPEAVWLEAIVNAVTHRAYSIGGDHIRVEIFDDRLEVESPGRLPGLVRLDNIQSSRFARNPRVARALNDLGFGRELGEGVNRMFEEMSQVGLPDPVYAELSGSVRVTLLADPLAARIMRRLPVGSERFVEFLVQSDRVTTPQAAELLAVSRPTALKRLRELRDAGLLDHVASSPRDRRGYWRLRRGLPPSSYL
jgi:ATP-dependent DNA helicase RecG